MPPFSRSASRPFDDHTIVRYLLGDLAEEEAARLEERYFCDREFFAHVGAVEAKLIGSVGRLSDRDRALFEKKYLTVPALRAKVESARSGRVIKAKQAGPEERATIWHLFWRPSYAMAAVAGIVVVSTLVYWSNQRQKDPASTAVHIEKPTGTRVPTVVAMTLFPGVSRGSGSEARLLRLSPATDQVRLSLVTPTSGENVTLEAELLRVESEKRVSIRIAKDLRAVSSTSGSIVDVTLGATELATGDYLVYLRPAARSGSAGEPLEAYAFGVIRE